MPDCPLPLRVQFPHIAERFDLIWQGPSSFVLVYGVVLAVGVKGRVQVNQVHRLERPVLHDGEAIAVVEPIHAVTDTADRMKAEKGSETLRTLYLKQASTT